jgi:lysine decarboxylase
MGFDRDQMTASAAEHHRLNLPPQARQRMTPYVDALRAYARLGGPRCNVPGHKGGAGAPPALRELLGSEPFALDVPPLLWGVDDGGSPTPLEQALELAAEAWGARRSWFLTNGASQGNHIACLALRSLGTDIVVQRSAHSSTTAGMILADLRPTFVAPTVDRDFGVAHGVSAAALATVLADVPTAAAVHVTSPSYFGAVADVAALAREAHDRGAALIVDESWGSHFGFHPDVPAGALSQGADLVVSSTHKMAGSLTQSAMLHLGDGPYADILEDAIDRAFSLQQSTSASSLLLASLDAARQHIATAGRALLTQLLETIARTRREIAALPGLDVADAAFLAHDDVVAVDPLRVVIDVRARDLDGFGLRDQLRAWHALDFEVANPQALVAVFGASEANSAAADGLLAALAALPARNAARPAASVPLPPPWSESAMTPRAAYLAPQEIVDAEHAVGRISADTVAAYPPGIPNLLPGERISADVVTFLRECATGGGHVRGAVVPDVSRIRVVAT